MKNAYRASAHALILTHPFVMLKTAALIVIKRKHNTKKHNTVEPSIKETPNKGHNRKNLFIKDTFYSPKYLLSYYTNTFLTSEERTTSL